MSPPVGVLLRKMSDGCKVKNTISVVNTMMAAASANWVRRSTKIAVATDILVSVSALSVSALSVGKFGFVIGGV